MGYLVEIECKWCNTMRYHWEGKYQWRNISMMRVCAEKSDIIGSRNNVIGIYVYIYIYT